MCECCGGARDNGKAQRKSRGKEGIRLHQLWVMKMGGGGD